MSHLNSRICPLFLPEDILQLNNAFHFVGTALWDTTLGAKHFVLAPGNEIITPLARGTTYHSLQVRIETNNISDEQLRDILGFLNSCGALRVRRKSLGHIQAMALRMQAAALGVTYPSLSHRHTYSFWSLVQFTVRACAGLGLASLACCLLIGGVSNVSILQSLCWFLATIVIIVGSIIAHESGHTIMLSRYSEPTVVFQSGMHIGLLHKQLDRQPARAVALSGPICGVMACTLAITLIEFTHLGNVLPVALIMLCMHIICLFPSYEDGAVLYKSFNRKKHRGLI